MQEHCRTIRRSRSDLLVPVGSTGRRLHDRNERAASNAKKGRVREAFYWGRRLLEAHLGWASKCTPKNKRNHAEGTKSFVVEGRLDGPVAGSISLGVRAPDGPLEAGAQAGANGYGLLFARKAAIRVRSASKRTQERARWARAGDRAGGDRRADGRSVQETAVYTLLCPARSSTFDHLERAPASQSGRRRCPRCSRPTCTSPWFVDFPAR